MDRASLLTHPFGAMIAPYGEMPHTGRTPILNLDIINSILKSLRRKQDISSLMKTCRSIYDLGIPTLLHRFLPNRTPESLESFHSFMFSNRNKSLNRFLSLHHLELGLYYRETETHQMMKWQLLKHARYLRELELELPNRFFNSGPEPFESVMDFPHLATLRILDAESKVIDWIRSTKSPITNLVLDFSCTELTPDILPALSIVSNHLVELSLDSVEISRIAFQLPNVHTLFVHSQEVTPAAILFSAFPNVQSLDIRMHAIESHDYPYDDGMHQTHNLNSAELYRLFRSIPSLKYLKAEPIDMYLSSLICTAEEYHVVEFDHETIPWLLLLLPQIRPSSITFELDVGYAEELPLSTLEHMLHEMSNITVLKKVDMRLRLSGGPAEIVKEIIVRLYFCYHNLDRSVHTCCRNACQTSSAYYLSNPWN